MAWTVVQAWGSRLVSIGVFAVLARQLDPADFGVMALGVAVIEFGRILIDQSLSRSIVQRDTVDDGHLDTAFWSILAVGAALTLIALALSPVAAAAFDEPTLAPVLRVLSVNFVLMAFASTQMAVLQRSMRFRGLAVRQLVSVVVGGGVGVATAMAGGGVWALVTQNVTQSLVAVAVLWTVSPWRPGRRVSVARFKEMASFGSTTLAIEVMGYFAKRGDDLLIGAFLGSAALGFFNIAYRILTILMEVFASTINAVAFPVFSRLQRDPDRLRRALHLATRTSSAVAFPAFLGLVVLAPELIRVVFGDGWGPSGDVLRILALAGVLRSVTHFNRSILLALGKPSWELGLETVSVATKVAAFAIGVQWGIAGVAWAIVIHGYLLAPVALALVNRANPLHPARYLRQFVAPMIASVALLAAATGAKALVGDGVSDAGVLLIAGGAGGFAYLGTLALVGPSLLRELRERVGDLRGPERKTIP